MSNAGHARKSKREQILDAATMIYANSGFEGATLQRMAEEAGVSKALVLKYFGSKQGLVRAVTDRTIKMQMERLERIDSKPGTTLRQRNAKLAELLQPAREEWCLILGTLLVPSFEFHMRGELEKYAQFDYKHTLRHRQEFIIPDDEKIFAYTYTCICLFIGYIVGGQAESFQRALQVHQDMYLLPDEPLPRPEPEG